MVSVKQFVFIEWVCFGSLKGQGKKKSLSRGKESDAFLEREYYFDFKSINERKVYSTIEGVATKDSRVFSSAQYV